MANPTYNAGTAAVTTTAAVACTLSAATTDGAMLQNVGSTTIYLGGFTVTATGATAGFPRAENASLTLASTGGQPHDLYAVVASGTGSLAYIFPAS